MTEQKIFDIKNFVAARFIVVGLKILLKMGTKSTKNTEKIKKWLGLGGIAVRIGRHKKRREKSRL
jgi:hypothetical protein